MKNKSLEERYADDILTDNAALDKYRQCKDCIFRDDGTIYSNHYQKGCCRMYPYPKFKPNDVMMTEPNVSITNKKRSVRNKHF
jgi:hypothetical protein